MDSYFRNRKWDNDRRQTYHILRWLLKPRWQMLYRWWFYSFSGRKPCCGHSIHMISTASGALRQLMSTCLQDVIRSAAISVSASYHRLPAPPPPFFPTDFLCSCMREHCCIEPERPFCYSIFTETAGQSSEMWQSICSSLIIWTGVKPNLLSSFLENWQYKKK